MTSSPWAALLVALAAGNPARLAVALAPAAGSARALGVLLAAGVLGAVGLAAGALLGALDVSVPTALVAAGLVVGLTGLVDLATPPPRALPGVGERGAWACPIAFPHLLRPQLALAALAAGAAHGAAFGLAAAVIAPVTAALCAAALPGGAEPRGGARAITLGAARLVAAAGVLGAIDLVLDGIFAV